MTPSDDLVVPRPAPAAAIVLAGGAGRRLGGVDKPGLVVAGVTLLDRALIAVGAVPTVVVGPVRPTSRPVTSVREDPPGSGPAAAVAAGVAALPVVPPDAIVVLLAADLPAVAVGSVHRLVTALSGADADGAVLTDVDGREQSLLSAWRAGPLRAACTGRASWAGAPLRVLLAPLRRVTVPAVSDEAADIDTPEQWRRWTQA